MHFSFKGRIMTSEIIEQEKKIYILPKTDLTASTAKTFKDELISQIEKYPVELVIDLSDVKMIDSTGLGVIIAAFNSLKKNDGTLIIENASKEVHNIFITMRLDKHFSIKTVG